MLLSKLLLADAFIVSTLLMQCGGERNDVILYCYKIY